MPHQTRRRAELPLPVEATWLRRSDPLPGGARRVSLEDLLQTLPDRPELEQLYRRDVPLDQLLRLLGHHVDSRKIRALARSEDPRREIRRLLSGA